jgi:predicted helicase
MPLAALDQLSRIKAAQAAAFDGFHALTVDNACRGAGSTLSSDQAAMTIRGGFR